MRVDDYSVRQAAFRVLLSSSASVLPRWLPYDSLVTDAQRAIAESFISQAYLNMPLSRFDDGAKSEYMAQANDDLTNKQYVDGQVAAEATARQNADNALQNSKYDKTGGAIGGDVQITGDLTVNGTTTTNDAETLQVKDNYIVTNSDGATLAGYSGILIRTNSIVTYGITYDPIRNAVLLGQGVYNSDGTFSFNSGEGLPVAIRAVSTLWTTGPVWDSTNNQFVDGGKSLSDLQEALTFDNAPTQGSNNPVTSGGIYTSLQSYATLAGNNTFTGNNTFDSPITVSGFANGNYSYTFPNESGTIALTSALEAITDSETIEPVNKLDLNSLVSSCQFANPGLFKKNLILPTRVRLFFMCGILCVRYFMIRFIFSFQFAPQCGSARSCAGLSTKGERLPNKKQSPDFRRGFRFRRGAEWDC